MVMVMGRIRLMVRVSGEGLLRPSRTGTVRGAGGCWVPNKAWPGIVFSHWGRLELNHTSNTDYGPDDYSKAFVSADMDTDWRDAFEKHPCFDPKKVCTVLVLVLSSCRQAASFQPWHMSPPLALKRTWPVLRSHRTLFHEWEKGLEAAHYGISGCAVNSAAVWSGGGVGRPTAFARPCNAT